MNDASRVGKVARGSEESDGLSLLLGGLREPGNWESGCSRRPWLLAVVLLGPVVLGILATLILLLTGHAGAP